MPLSPRALAERSLIIVLLGLMVPLSPRALAERSLVIVLSRINDAPFATCLGRKKLNYCVV